jgi:nitroreductase
MEQPGTLPAGTVSAVVDRTIRQRRTSKLLGSPEQLEQSAALWSSDHRHELESMIETASWAPFHRRAHEQTHRSGALSSIVPWRFHILERPACLALLDYLRQQAETQPDSMWARAWQSKIKNMLAATGCLVQATWLPDPAEDGGEPELSRNNIEHVAAAAAAVQNLLLAAESRSWHSYWSSGGILREEALFDYLGIGRNEALLGSVFLAPVVADGVNVVEGGLRDQRGDVSGWSRWVEL